MWLAYLPLDFKGILAKIKPPTKLKTQDIMIAVFLDNPEAETASTISAAEML